MASCREGEAVRHASHVEFIQDVATGRRIAHSVRLRTEEGPIVLERNLSVGRTQLGRRRICEPHSATEVVALAKHARQRCLDEEAAGQDIGEDTQRPGDPVDVEEDAHRKGAVDGQRTCHTNMW